MHLNIINQPSQRAVQATTPNRFGSVALSQGIRVEAQPCRMDDQSDPSARKYVFGYRIVITNQSDQAAQVMARRWLIIDAAGREREVRGEGVIGQQPVLQPGESFEYSSFCPLPTPWGTMEGAYLIQGESGPFTAQIGRFYLVWEQPEPATT